MVTVKDAVGAATAFVGDMYGSTAGKYTILEEVELADNEQIWLITLSIDWGASFPGTQSKSSVITPGSETRLKLFRVDAESGEVLSMKSPD